MSTELVDIHPRELEFIFELKKQSTSSVRLVNRTNLPVAFKVKTTSPKKYCVRPNVGVIDPKSSCHFTVTMQAQRVAPPDLVCKDKFLVQTTVVPEGTTDEDIVSSMFLKDGGRYVEENKLKVLLMSPPHSPISSPLNGVHNYMPENAPPLPKEEAFTGVQFVNPVTKKSTDDITLPKSDVIEQKTTPIITLHKSDTIEQQNVQLPSNIKSDSIEQKAPPIINLQKSDSFEQKAPLDKIHSEDITLQNHEITLPEKHSEVPKNEAVTVTENKDIENMSVQSNEPIKDITLQQKTHSEDIINLQKNETIEDISLLKKNINIEDNKNNSEDISLQNKVAEDTKEIKKGAGEELIEAVPVENVRMKDVEDIELVKEINKMKLKLNELDLKLNEAEVMISKLTEEKRLSTQERESLSNELGDLKSKGDVKRVRDGFPLLFVVMVALISVVLGHLSRC